MPRPFRYDRFPSRPRSRAARARWPLFVTTLAWLCAAAAVAQTPTGTPGIPEAMARLNAGDAAGASRILEGVVARSPDNARAWRALGQVARQAGQLDRALQAYVRADFANPFVEPVQIIHEWVGEGINDQFGWIARNIGDVDGDGVNDVVTSAPTKQINGTPAGRLYVYSSRSGRLVWRDGDGHDDLIVGAWQHASGAVSGGRATLFSGQDGRV
ncbi:MAG TPA: tetratricopeptide repeat protein, partial [Gemmatimonadaceae bacterium]